MFPVILAHGALGPFDEIILIGIAIAFIGMMGFSWWRSRQELDYEDTKADASSPTTDNLEPTANRDSTETADRFRLD